MKDELKRGDLIRVTVNSEWAKRVHADEVIDLMPEVRTEDSTSFTGVVHSTDHQGLWLGRAVPAKSDIKTRLLVPWAYVLSVRTNILFASEPNPVGLAPNENQTVRRSPTSTRKK
jgi:hypothetical protein